MLVIFKNSNIDKLRKILALYNFSLPIASDPTLEVCRNYHAFWLRGLGLRKITYVIDKNGFIRGRLNHHLFTEKSWGPVMRLLQELTIKEWRKGILEKSFIAPIKFATPWIFQPSNYLRIILYRNKSQFGNL